MERNLANYIKKAAAIFYGITIHELRILASKLAIANKLEKLPLSLMQHEKAGNDWARGFLKRHTDISLRTLESKSIERMANFNKSTAGLFFKDLKKFSVGKVGLVLTRYGMLMKLV